MARRAESAPRVPVGPWHDRRQRDECPVMLPRRQTMQVLAQHRALLVAGKQAVEGVLLSYKRSFLRRCGEEVENCLSVHDWLHHYASQKHHLTY